MAEIKGRGHWTFECLINYYFRYRFVCAPVRVSKDKLYMRVTKCISSGIAFIYLVIWPCDSLLLTHTAYTGLSDHDKS